MRSIQSRIAGVLLAAIAAAGLSACGGGAQANEGHEIRQLPASLLPTSMRGLTIGQEKLAEGVKDQKRTYLDAVGLYSFRKGDLLQATLQISKFTSAARYRKREFRQGILEQVGTTVPRQFRMGNQTVYLTTGKRQNVVIWFEGRYLMILSTREEFGEGRGLLRDLLDVDL
ncbi:MAG: hypothetical protein LC792_19230 [Actinobacteria bacterium]|nr:hypothetical protein [Actinomycetota bacterium]